jgi:hypothetical protein
MKKVVRLGVTVSIPEYLSDEAVEAAQAKLRQVFAYAGLEDGLRCRIDYDIKPQVKDDSDA